MVEDLAARLGAIRGTLTMVLVEQSENALLALVDRRVRMRLGRLEPAAATAG